MPLNVSLCFVSLKSRLDAFLDLACRRTIREPSQMMDLLVTLGFAPELLTPRTCTSGRKMPRSRSEGQPLRKSRDMLLMETETVLLSWSTNALIKREKNLSMAARACCLG